MGLGATIGKQGIIPGAAYGFLAPASLTGECYETAIIAPLGISWGMELSTAVDTYFRSHSTPPGCLLRVKWGMWPGVPHLSTDDQSALAQL